MAKAIFSVLFSVIKSILNIGLSPINLLVANLVPDFSSMITLFNSTVTRYIGVGIGFFSVLLPPTTKTLIGIYLLFLTTYYTITISAHAVLKIFKIIKAIKFW